MFTNNSFYNQVKLIRVDLEFTRLHPYPCLKLLEFQCYVNILIIRRKMPYFLRKIKIGSEMMYYHSIWSVVLINRGIIMRLWHIILEPIYIYIYYPNRGEVTVSMWLKNYQSCKTCNNHHDIVNYILHIMIYSQSVALHRCLVCWGPGLVGHQTKGRSLQWGLNLKKCQARGRIWYI